MPTLPDDRFELPEDFGPGSVWADRTGHRTLMGRNQRGVEIPIGHGEGQINPGELLKLALIGCAGMSADNAIARRLGQQVDLRLWAHGTADEELNRYERIVEELQLPLEGLSEEQVQALGTVIQRAIVAGCTVERTVVPGVEVKHRPLRAESNASARDAASAEGDPSAADGTSADAASPHPGEEQA
ncbi:OsmC family protein [Brachybacterium sp. UMB0905]|uniref:OsmC family protein n=1 Tax=Brachybacterium sp. UMB0905 TaxID=2069310 RepID=UPI000C802E8C|nr:OsmC family protein [Brachybacterium sp. UMB0905]PMC75385.1 osmotically inducible protein C [Brachybacterium sp. UMB0905]